ncbi:thioredoxin, partial [Campylobacter jejuni]|nr:thioredoxin [Campylobacter jejuni]
FAQAKEGVALVDFWAPWCGPFRMLAPVIDELANDFDGKAKICKVNTDEQGDLAAEFGVRSIPPLIFFKNGEVVDQLVGAQSKQAIS